MTVTRSAADASERLQPERATAAGLGSALQALTTFGPPITVMTSLLFFFGYRRTVEQARYLGLDAGVLDMSTQDYLLRSVSSLFLPIMVIAAVVLAWLWVHSKVLALLDRDLLEQGRWRRALRGVSWLLGVTWLLLPAGVLLAVPRGPAGQDLALPLSLIAGILLTAYGVWLRGELYGSRAPAPAPAWQATLAHLCVGVLVTLNLFWAVASYAEIVGRGLGERIAQDVSSRVSVVVYSPTRLHLGAPGVAETEFSQEQSTERYRYTGLRLLQRSGGKYFLLSDGWTRDAGVVVVLDDDDVRLEFHH